MDHKIKTFENACESLGLDAGNIIPDFSIFPEKHQKSLVAYAKLSIISEALNEGWKPDWDNYSERKYVPWFESSGSGVSYDDFVLWRANAHVGSRLCYKSRELAEYAGKQFIEIYNDYITL